jgi:hypothetical protein
MSSQNSPFKKNGKGNRRTNNNGSIHGKPQAISDTNPIEDKFTASSMASVGPVKFPLNMLAFHLKNERSNQPRLEDIRQVFAKPSTGLVFKITGSNAIAIHSISFLKASKTSKLLDIGRKA